MSTVATIWAAGQHPPRPADKLVLWAMADAARGELHCFASVASVVEFTGLDRKTVLASQHRLKALGLIVDTGDRRGDTRQIIVWALPVDDPPSVVVPQAAPGSDPQEELAQNSTGSGTVPKAEQYQKRNSTVFSSKRSRKRDTEPVSEPVPSQANACSGLIIAREPPRRAIRAGFAPPPGVSDEQWAGFLDHRRNLRKSLTDRGYLVLCNRLAAMAEDGWPPGEMIDRATENRWTSVHPPGGGSSRAQRHPDRPRYRDPLLNLLAREGPAALD